MRQDDRPKLPRAAFKPDLAVPFRAERDTWVLLQTSPAIRVLAASNCAARLLHEASALTHSVGKDDPNLYAYFVRPALFLGA